jgi:hypothetical protein
MYNKAFLIYIPDIFKVAVISNNTSCNWILAYNKNYQFVFPFNTTYSTLGIGFNSNSIKLETLFASSYYASYSSYYNKIIATFYKPCFSKIKFRGKGYYIYKNIRNTIAPQFGFSHRLYIYSNFTKVKFIGKTKVILFGLVKEDLVAASLCLKSKRPINIFTGRGVRFSRQVVYKKQGKVSSYR